MEDLVELDDLGLLEVGDALEGLEVCCGAEEGAHARALGVG